MKKKLKKEITEWVVIILVVLLVINTSLGTQLAAFVQKGVLLTGLVTPDKLDKEEIKKANYSFIVSDINGKKIPFDDLKGKTIFLNFWATWCPPCIAEMPSINNLYKSLSDRQDIVFIMISLDKNREKAKEFMVEESLDLPIYYLESGLPNVYDTHSIPTTYVISPSGNIEVERHSIAKYDSEKFRNLLLDMR